jgi:hypothetical protein
VTNHKLPPGKASTVLNTYLTLKRDVSLGNSCLRGFKFPRKKSLSLLSKFSNERVTEFGANANGEVKQRLLLFRTAKNTQTLKKVAKFSLPVISKTWFGRQIFRDMVVRCSVTETREMELGE